MAEQCVQIERGHHSVLVVPGPMWNGIILLRRVIFLTPFHFEQTRRSIQWHSK